VFYVFCLLVLIWSSVASDAESEDDTDRGCRVNAYSQLCLSIEIVYCLETVLRHILCVLVLVLVSGGTVLLTLLGLCG